MDAATSKIGGAWRAVKKQLVRWLVARIANPPPRRPSIADGLAIRPTMSARLILLRPLRSCGWPQGTPRRFLVHRLKRARTHPREGDRDGVDAEYTSSSLFLALALGDTRLFSSMPPFQITAEQRRGSILRLVAKGGFGRNEPATSHGRTHEGTDSTLLVREAAAGSPHVRFDGEQSGNERQASVPAFDSIGWSTYFFAAPAKVLTTSRGAVDCWHRPEGPCRQRSTASRDPGGGAHSRASPAAV
jgi:hypothetical protein